MESPDRRRKLSGLFAVHEIKFTKGNSQVNKKFIKRNFYFYDWKLNFPKVKIKPALGGQKFLECIAAILNLLIFLGFFLPQLFH